MYAPGAFFPLSSVRSLPSPSSSSFVKVLAFLSLPLLLEMRKAENQLGREGGGEKSSSDGASWLSPPLSFSLSLLKKH